MADNLKSSEYVIGTFVAFLRTFESQCPGFLELLAEHWERIQKNPDAVDISLMETFRPLIRFSLGEMDMKEAKEVLGHPPNIGPGHF